MRKIKYRVWDKNGSRCDESMFRLGLDGILWKYCCGCDWYDQDSKDFTVEQFTGLLDRNGKEVYDGDIAVWFYGNTSHLGKIIWAEQVGKFMFKDFDDNNAYDFKTIQVDRELEVIGNAHETDIDSIILRFMSNCYLQKEGII